MGYYTDSEIIGMFRNAKFPEDQIEILSQLNGCTRAEIIRILEKHGVYAGPNSLPKTTKLKHQSTRRTQAELDTEFRRYYNEGLLCGGGPAVIFLRIRTKSKTT